MPDVLSPGPLEPDTRADRPDPYRDESTILALIRETVEDYRASRRFLEQGWYEAVLFYKGIQWTYFNIAQNTWVEKRLAHWVPKPARNLFASAIDTQKAVLLRIKPSFTYAPMTGDPDDIAAADVADAVAEVVRTESGIDREMHRIAFWCVLTGNAYLFNFYDRDLKHGKVRIPYMACATCRKAFLPKQIEASRMACPACDATEGFAPSGQVAEYPRGKIVAQALSPFEVFPGDPELTWMEEQTRVVIRRRISLRAAKERYPDRATEIGPDQKVDQGLVYQEAMTYLSGQAAYEGPFTFATRSGHTRDRVTEQILIQLPTHSGEHPYPEGLFAVVFGDKLMEAAPIPTRWDDGTPFIPLTQFVFHPIGQSFYAKAPAQDLVGVQRDRNVIDSQFQLCLRRMGNPIWLVPEGTGAVGFNGEPGWRLNYNALNPAKAKPDRIPGQNPPPAFLQYMVRLAEEMNDIAANYDILKGARPPGVSAGYALQILQERGQSRFGPVFDAWERALVDQTRQQIAIFRSFATEPRIRRIKGRNSQWSVQQFTNADLKGSVDVRVEAGSSAPKSAVADRVVIDGLIQRGLINAAIPEVNRRILEKFGVPELNDPFNKSLLAIFREQDRFLKMPYRDPAFMAKLQQLGQEAGQAIAQAQQAMRAIQQVQAQAQATAAGAGQPANVIPLPPPPQTAEQLQAVAQQSIQLMQEVCGLVLRETDDHPLSVAYHEELARTEEYEALPRPVQKIFEMHVRGHRERVLGQAAEQAQALAPAANAAKAGVPVGGPKPGMRRPNQFRPQGVSTRQVWKQGATPEEAALASSAARGGGP